MYSSSIPSSLLDGVIVTSYTGDRSSQDGSYHSLHGDCNATFFNGVKYQGSFFQGHLHGQGRLAYPDGVEYEGHFKFNKMQGFGTLKWSDGSTYKGEIKDGKRNGFGEYSNEKESVYYKGTWKDGKRDGRGRLTHSKDSWYEGEWKDGERHGKGTMRFDSGETYRGEWENDLPSGFGEMNWPEKRERYIGWWKEGKPHGRGQYFWNPKRPLFDASEKEREKETNALPWTQLCNHYDGEWSSGMRDGQGTFFYADGSRYHGGWKENEKHGQGVYTFADGRVYVGEFKNDKMTGQEPPAASHNSAAFGTIGVQLYLDDLVPGIGPNVRRVHREVQNVLLRWNSHLRSLFFTCSQALQPFRDTPESCPSSPTSLPSSKDEDEISEEEGDLEDMEVTDTQGDLYTLSLWQLWVICKVCGLQDTNLTLVQIDRILSTVRLNHGYSSRELQNIHDPQQSILFREFVQALVRIAFTKYHEQHSQQRPDHDPSTLADCVSKLIENNLAQFETVSEERLEAIVHQVALALRYQKSSRPPPQVKSGHTFEDEPELEDDEGVEATQDVDTKLFDLCASAIDLQTADRVATARDLYKRLSLSSLMKPCGLIIHYDTSKQDEREDERQEQCEGEKGFVEQEDDEDAQGEQLDDSREQKEEGNEDTEEEKIEGEDEAEPLVIHVDRKSILDAVSKAVFENRQVQVADLLNTEMLPHEFSSVLQHLVQAIHENHPSKRMRRVPQSVILSYIRGALKNPFNSPSQHL